MTGAFFIALSLLAGNALAQNAGCSVSSSVANCTQGVGAAGIAYDKESDGVANINVIDNSSGAVTDVNDGVIGVELTGGGGPSFSDGTSSDPDLQQESVGVTVNRDSSGNFTGYTFSATNANFDTDASADTFNTVLLASSDPPSSNTYTDLSRFVQVDSSYAEVRDITGSDELYALRQSASETSVAFTDAQIDAVFSSTDGSGGNYDATSGTLLLNNKVDGAGQGGSLTTNNAHGLYAKSTGRNGGKGGSINILGIYSKGKPGGAGEGASAVAVNNDGTIIVTGTTANQYGVAAISQGGDGGKGGGSPALGSDSGRGGRGGNGGDVTITLDSTSDVSTANEGGHGVYALSQGGDGGRSGDDSGLVYAGTDRGGDGGDGGNVVISNAGAVTTTGDAAHGLYGASLGGSGNGASDVGGIFTVGGKGGAGANAGTVTVTNNGDVITSGIGGFGILAQSVGGGGGDGSDASGAVAVAGGGETGGDGDAVQVTQTLGSIETFGQRGSGIVAQSIGGGGGNGGTAVSASVFASVAVGGSGAGGGVGGTVGVNLDGEITTHSDEAAAVIAQSIGGGGGNGGSATSVAIGAFVGVAVGLGGNGGEGGTASAVNVTTDATINTYGQRSTGILAQSVAGGGGNGGTSVAIAASGGIGGSVSAAVSLGGVGGEGGVADSVTVDNSGALIKTRGDSASAIVAQSIGGGGGSGGSAISGTLTFSDGFTASASVAQGGDAGDAGTAGDVLVCNGAFDAVSGRCVTASAASTAGNIETSGADSFGILAQSIGGQGGAGGNSIAGSINVSGGGGLQANVALAGGGGDGGEGGNVSVISNADITTLGDRASAIVAQSMGGAGGAGGVAVAAGANVSGSSGFAANVSLGGSGGDGGEAGDVLVCNGGYVMAASGLTCEASGTAAGVIATGSKGSYTFTLPTHITGVGGLEVTTETVSGADAVGILAQSIGGQGGSGGTSVAAGLSISGSSSLNAGVSLGGDGGDGGIGGDVTVFNNAGITTLGDRASGIVAQSIGGNGGQGGVSVGASATFSSSSSLTANVTMGGTGGKGGVGGAVSVTNKGDITTGTTYATEILDVETDELVSLEATSGADAIGILAQSIGGKGGAGGTSVAASLSVSGSSSLTANVGIGGDGGNGGSGGDVEVDNEGTIVTLGDRASGILAQSLGGTGGAGGTAVAGGISVSNSGTLAASVGIGGAGGTGASSGTVTVTNDGAIETTGADAFGVAAQSIGGDGGAGGLSVAAAVSASTQSSASIGVSLGGTGGAGARSDLVTIENSALIQTHGDRSAGILAQSLGGGGGAGGAAIAGTLNFSKSSGAAISVGLGGTAGGGGIAALRDTTGTLDTSLDIVSVTNTGSITTQGADAAGILAQAIGGQGGLGGLSVAGAINVSGESGGSVGVSIGGNGGDAGTAGSVTVTNDGTIAPVIIITEGARSGGVVAQSIGGQGGAGGLAVAASVAATKDKSGAVSVGIGGGGGAGGTAGNVTVTNVGEGLIMTSGESRDAATREAINTDAHGILAQSIGGNGGQGGIGAAGTFAVGAQQTVAIGVGIGGTGAVGGKGGEVLVDNDYDIGTGGFSSIGIVAQSIGGDGGAGGGAIALGFGGSQQNSGGQIGVAVGGGGGDGGEASLVTVLQNGDISTEGDNAHAILAQSIGGYGGQGGFSVSAGGTYSGGSDKFSGSVNVAVGGSGGDGGTAGGVIVGSSAETLTGTYYTSGENAVGIIAQSIGGSGGAGGFAGSLATVVSTNKAKTTAIGVSVGGFGGKGGQAGEVSVNSDADIVTEGAFSYGMLAQSIGGKGGQGGGSVSGALNITTSPQGNNSINASVAVGGFGGDGGKGDDVTVTNSGSIMTGVRAATVVFDYGDDGVDGLTIIDPATGEEVSITGKHLVKDTGLFAHGIVAQSISGDGGAGGFAGSILFTRGTSDQKVSNYNASLSVGGLGGDGADVAGVVRVTNLADGVIGTQGERAVGILAQSIGGSGGAGGDSGLGDDFWGEEFVGDTAVTKAIAGDTSEIELGAGGSLVGASGANSNSLSVAVGGVGGAGANANAVYVDNAGQIITVGTKSHGIQAQSIGGGGGSGGLSTAASAAVQASKSRSISLGVGGVGLSGGNGGLVDVTNSGRILTLGRGAAAIYAQSVGGGGGSGGDTVGFTLQRKDTSIESEDKELNKLKSGFQLTAVVGGMAGNGGKGGDVVVVNEETGDIETVGTLSYGVFAQSVGGGGGDGGNASVSSKEIGAFLENDKTEKKQFRTGKYKFAVGGWGGSGGLGGDVTVTNDGSIVTHGEMAVAVYAQSVGGGGGVGGKASTGLTGDIQLGGFGGKGNDGGTVIVNNTGYISTDDNLAHGIFAQSVGGGGGDGGASEFGSARSFRGDWFKAVRQKGTSEGTSKFFKEKILAPTFGIGVGGFGGSAGDGGDVIVCNGSTWNAGTKTCDVDLTIDPATAAELAEIVTTGVSAHGIFAQSVGGGGGVGGSTTLTNVGKVGIGGLGGAAGDGGDVFVQNDGAISTQGEGAYGIFAQSVGGGGGASGDITFGIEGFGEDVSKIERGIDKLADNATEAVPVDLDDNGVISESEQVYSDLVNGVPVDPARLGVTGISELTDGKLDFNGDGEGDIALDALQEVGGKISITEKFDLDRNGLPISDELKSAFTGLYNAGASNSNSDAATSLLGFTGVENYAGLSGESTDAAAQAALVNLLTSKLLNTPTNSILDGLAVAWDPSATSYADADKTKIFGGAFKDIGLENLSGEDILSIVQQLNSGSVDADGFVEISGIGPDPAISFRIPLLDGANGNGGDVTVIHNGDIYVAGGASDDLEERAGSIGIFAQSVGGGGGIVAETETFNEADLLVDPDDPNSAKGVDINDDGDTTDDFEFSVGRAFAGTIGGQGNGGAVTVIHNGNIVAPAWNGYAIFAQSVGGNGGGPVHVELNGVIVGGLGDEDNTSATVLIDGGATGTTDFNELILGSDTFLFGLGDRVISGTFGNDLVTLQSGGQVIGNINLVTNSRGTDRSTYSDFNSFTVEPGAILRTREIVNLGDLDPSTFGDGGLLTIAGTLIVGGEVEDPDLETWVEHNPYGLTPLQAVAALNAKSFHILQNQVTTTVLTGRFLMEDTTPGDDTYPELLVDVRFGNDTDQSDLITTTDSATVAGIIRPTLLSLSKVTPPVTIIDPTDGTGAATNNGAVAEDTVVINYSVGIDGVAKDGQIASGTKTIDLLIDSVDFSIDGMTRNQTAVGNHINAILTGDGVTGGSENLLTQLIALIGNKPLGSEDEVIDLIDRLTTEGYAATRVDTLLAGKEFADALSDCERRTPDGLKPQRGQCLFADVTGRFLRKEASYQFKDIESNSFQFVGGTKFPIAESWRLGFAAGYENVDLALGDRFGSQGDRGHAGVEVEQLTGNFTFGAALTGSYGAYETKRRIGIDERISSIDSTRVKIGTAEADDSVAETNMRLGAAYRLSLMSQPGGSWYLSPSINVDATYIHSFDATETGAGAVGVRLHDTGEWIFSASPMLEIGGLFNLQGGIAIKPYLRGGLTVFSDDELSIDAAFIGAPGSAGTFTNWSNFDDVVGRVSAGLSVYQEDAVDFSFGYEGLFGDTIEQHSAKARITIDLN